MIKPTPDIFYIIILNMNFQMFYILQTNDLQKNRLMRVFIFFFDKLFRLSLFINRYIIMCKDFMILFLSDISLVWAQLL